MESVISTSDKKCNKLKVSTGKIHSYIGMVFDFTHSENVSVNQTGMIEDVIGTTCATVKEYIASPLSTEQRTFA